MTIKQKLSKEINTLPEGALIQLYRYLQDAKKARKRKPVKGVSEDQAWQQLALKEFLNGYDKGDEIYDKL
jgi:hypothetical protein